MLLLSAVVVYAVSIAGVKSGKLKKDVSWEHPIFVALFTRELNDVSMDAQNSGSVYNENNSDDINRPNNMNNDGNENHPYVTEQDSSRSQTKDVSQIETYPKATMSESSEYDSTDDIKTSEDAKKESQPDTDEPSESETVADTENVSEETSEAYGQYSGQVEYVKTDTRYARSGYYSDFDTVARSSNLDYVHVENDYFSDACFIGDSRMEGMYFYGDLREADFIYKPGATVYDIMDRKMSFNGDGAEGIADYLSRRQYSQIYIMIGVNELGDKNPEEYAKAYADDIGRIRSMQPDAIIFIMGMMHVTTWYSDSSDVFNNDNIDARNTAAAAIANGKDIFYLDMNESVDDGCGGVVGDYSFDGVHLKAEYYKLWTEWMKAHGVKNLIKQSS